MKRATVGSGRFGHVSAVIPETYATNSAFPSITRDKSGQGAYLNKECLMISSDVFALSSATPFTSVPLMT